MLSRTGGYLRPRAAETAPAASRQLEQQGYAVLRGVLHGEDLAAAQAEITAIYDAIPAEGRAGVQDEDFRYEMLNKSPCAQRLVAWPEILAAIEPLLGEDCHVIANTCWRNPAGAVHAHGGGGWHIDAGPHIPRPPGTPWPADLPYPVFAIGVHIFLADCDLESGPTAVIPYSHKCGQPPPAERRMDASLTCDGRAAEPLVAAAGDVALFVSDIWHRRLPTGPGDAGRFFLQVHYGRRDIAQRLKPTSAVNHLDAAALGRIASSREARLLGLHPPGFYDG